MVLQLRFAFWASLHLREETWQNCQAVDGFAIPDQPQVSGKFPSPAVLDVVPAVLDSILRAIYSRATDRKDKPSAAVRSRLDGVLIALPSLGSRSWDRAAGHEFQAALLPSHDGVRYIKAALRSSQACLMESSAASWAPGSSTTTTWEEAME